jgi:hypothetical protein
MPEFYTTHFSTLRVVGIIDASWMRETKDKEKGK